MSMRIMEGNENEIEMEVAMNCGERSIEKIWYYIYIDIKCIKIYVVIEWQRVRSQKQPCLTSFATESKTRGKLVLNSSKPCLRCPNVASFIIVEFIDRVGAFSNEVCEKEGKKTISSDHFYKAIKVTIFLPRN